MDDRSLHILDHWLLAGVPRDQLLQLLANAQEVRFLPGEVVFEEGDAADGLYLLASGSVRVTAKNERGDVFLAEIGADDVLGEMGVLEGAPRSGTATALGPCAAYFVPAEPFLDTLERSPAVCIRLLAVLTQRLRRTNEPLKRLPRSAAADDLLLAQALGIEGAAPAAPPRAAPEPSPDFRPPTDDPKGLLTPDTETFYAWLTGRAHWEEQIGDLARLARSDAAWPRDADDVETIRRHLDGVGIDPSMQPALTAAWRRWRIATRLADPGAMLD